MKIEVRGDKLLVVEALPTETMWLKDLLTWEQHDGRTKSVFKDAGEIPWTYRHLLPEILKSAHNLLEIEVVGEAEGMEEILIPKVDPLCLEGIELRDYQTKAIRKALAGREGIVCSPTGSGKSEILLGLFQTAQPDQCFILVPTKYIAEEIYSRAKAYGIEDVGVLHGDIKSLKRLTVAVVDSLSSSLEKMDRFGIAYSEADMVLADEGHHLQAPSWRHCWIEAKKAIYKIAVTATPYNNPLQDPLHSYGDAMTLATAGPTLYTVSTQYLLERGVIAKTYTYYINLKGMRSAAKMSPTTVHTIHIVDNGSRNDQIVAVAKMAREYDMTVLILVNRHSHARKLMESLRGHKVICKFEGGRSLQFDELSGGIEDEQVSLSGAGSWVERFEGGEWDVVIGTPNFDEGVNLPKIDFTILAGGGKSFRRQIQRRGRGSRRKKEGYNWAFMVDFMDYQHVWLLSHSRKRKALFEASGSEIVEDKYRFWRLVRLCSESRK